MIQVYDGSGINLSAAEEAERLRVEAIPELCDRFETAKVDVMGRPRVYRCTGYYRLEPVTPALTQAQSLIDEIMDEEVGGRQRYRMFHCKRERAQLVGGYGIAGCILPIDKIKRGGPVGWSEKQVAEEHERCARRDGENCSWDVGGAKAVREYADDLGLP